MRKTSEPRRAKAKRKNPRTKPVRKAKRIKRIPKSPDFLARLKRIYGDRVLEVTGAELIAEDRDRW